MKTCKSLMIGVCFGAFAQISYAIPMLTWNADNTKVTGATGIESGGMTFSMEFVDGTCIALFGGCDADDDFLVPGTVTALQATELTNTTRFRCSFSYETGAA